MRAARRLPPTVAALLLLGCGTEAPTDDPRRLAELQATYDRLHERLEKASATEPLVASAFADRGQVVLAIRSGLIEQLAGNVARRYLDRVSLDMSEVKGHSSGEIGKDTFLGRIKIGHWNVSINLGELVGELRAGVPRVSLHGPDMIDIELPVDVEEAEGDATLRFAWDSSGVANAICKDFEITRTVRGRVLAQRHLIRGALRLANTGESLTATPVFPDRRVRLQLDLNPQSWNVVEAALRSQDDFAKCGTLMNPEECLLRLKELAARGVIVRLPQSVFRTIILPAQLQQSVKVDERSVGLRLTAQSLRIETATLWSSMSVEVQGNAKP